MKCYYGLFSITIIYPIFMVFITSFKKKREASYLSVSLPREWKWENYAEVWEQGMCFKH